MDYIISKLKGKDGIYEKLYSGETLYNLPGDLASAIEYTPSRMLEEDEWYKLEKFSQTDYCIDFLKNAFRSTDYSQAVKSKTETIEYIFAYQSGNYFFQRIFKNNILIQVP